MFPEASPSLTSKVIRIQPEREQTVHLALTLFLSLFLRRHAVHLPISATHKIFSSLNPQLSRHAAFDGQTRK